MLFKNFIMALLLVSLFSIQSCATFEYQEDSKKYDNSTKIVWSNYVDPNIRSVKNDRKLTVVVAISGGGYRASNYGLGALFVNEHPKLTHIGIEY